MLDKIPGESQPYLSINTISNPNEVVNYPTEFSNSIILPGLPLHKLELKIDVSIIRLCNLNPPKLCNGNKLRVVSLQRNVKENRVKSEVGLLKIVSFQEETKNGEEDFHGCFCSFALSILPP
ncbi:ATP-dependent DNA helicase [Trichonephila clavipes]|nr:ATP-dependent DNA helicase [Trichonephila clavipes]